MKQPCAIAISVVVLCFTTIAKANTAGEILDAAEIQGGLIVHLGCGDGKLTAALHAGDSCVVQGLDTDPQHIDAAPKHIQSFRLYGKVSADLFDGKQLPYVDNCVNLIVASDGCGVARDEMLRVLADAMASIEGRKGSLLWALSKADGAKLGECKRDSAPVFDGMIAANGCLYLAALDGRVVCLGADR